jgi:hypothetical protein
VPNPSPEVTRHRNRVAGLQRYGNPDPEKLGEAHHDLRAAKLAEHIERTLAAAPPLTAEQLSKLAELLKPARDAITKSRLAELNGRGDVA